MSQFNKHDKMETSNLNAILSINPVGYRVPETAGFFGSFNFSQ